MTAIADTGPGQLIRLHYLGYAVVEIRRYCGARLLFFVRCTRARGGAERRAESSPSFGPRRRPISF